MLFRSKSVLSSVNRLITARILEQRFTISFSSVIRNRYKTAYNNILAFSNNLNQGNDSEKLELPKYIMKNCIE